MGLSEENKTMGWYWIKRHQWTEWEAAYCPEVRGNVDCPRYFLRVESDVMCEPYRVGPRVKGMPEDDQ